MAPVARPLPWLAALLFAAWPSGWAVAQTPDAHAPAAGAPATALEVYAARLEAVAATYPQLPTILSDAFARPNGREAAVHPLRLLRGLLILFAAGTAALLLTRRVLAGPVRKLELDDGAPLLTGALRFVLGLVPVGAFALGVLVVYAIVRPPHPAAPAVLLAVLQAALTVLVTDRLIRFLCAPRRPRLRLIPLEDADARALHRTGVVTVTLAATVLGLIDLLLALGVGGNAIVAIGLPLSTVPFLYLLYRVWRGRAPVARAIARPLGVEVKDHPTLGLWAVAASVYLVALWLVVAAAAVRLEPATGPRMLASLLVALAVPGRRADGPAPARALLPGGGDGGGEGRGGAGDAGAVVGPVRRRRLRHRGHLGVPGGEGQRGDRHRPAAAVQRDGRAFAGLRRLDDGGAGDRPDAGGGPERRGVVARPALGDPAAAAAEVPSGRPGRHRGHDRSVLAGHRDRAAARRGGGGRHRHRVGRAIDHCRYPGRRLLPAGGRVPHGRLCGGRQPARHGGRHIPALLEAAPPPRRGAHAALRPDQGADQLQPRLGADAPGVPCPAGDRHGAGQEAGEGRRQGAFRRPGDGAKLHRTVEVPGRAAGGGRRGDHRRQVHHQAQRAVRHPARGVPSPDPRLPGPWHPSGRARRGGAGGRSGRRQPNHRLRRRPGHERHRQGERSRGVTPVTPPP
ncbi:membrane protein of unknown function (plasmid) [Azospirillum baldaniorum]|uniref:Uncharacterized protein n=1 Tax=Azospirillum baldaniorum TaxID=1064539 RepID=A0A9P1JXY6_9PROT|nr:membrane protein of unknown function [Azospirillum baldaniorum]